jgi:hypothetical protein
LKNNLYAYTVASNGKLTPVSGSPLSENIFTLAVNGKYLFGSYTNGDIHSFLMKSTGALGPDLKMNPNTNNPGGCGTQMYFQIDHSGDNLYNAIVDPDCYGTHYQYYKIESSTGGLQYLGETAEQSQPLYDLNFLGNNKFGYNPICTIDDHEEVGYTIGFERLSNGELPALSLGNLPPVTPENGNQYCPLSYATDPSDHIAALLEDEDADGDTYGQPVIATYTANSKGQLTTASTYKNMPKAPAAGTYFGWLSMSTSGKLLAAGGGDGAGVEIFHFYGTSQAKKFETLLAGQTITQAYWDKSNHLFLLGGSSNHGKLWVYTATTSSITVASGSPYSIPNPYAVIVQNK